jgi:hypothetical protein
MVNRAFTPSKTAQSGLNFITKDEEQTLASTAQPEDIVYVFKLIYIYLGESYDSLPDDAVIVHLITVLEAKYNVDNLSKYTYLQLESLFISHICKNVEFDSDRLKKVIELVKKCPKIISSSDFLKINRSMSYLTFILKEIYEYATTKSIDGVYVSQLRLLRDEIAVLNKRLESYRKLAN